MEWIGEYPVKSTLTNPRPLLISLIIINLFCTFVDIMIGEMLMGFFPFEVSSVLELNTNLIC